MAVGMRTQEEQLQNRGAPCGKEGLLGALSTMGGAIGICEGVGVSKDKFTSQGRGGPGG